MSLLFKVVSSRLQHNSRFHTAHYVYHTVSSLRYPGNLRQSLQSENENENHKKKKIFGLIGLGSKSKRMSILIQYKSGYTDFKDVLLLHCLLLLFLERFLILSIVFFSLFFFQSLSTTSLHACVNLPLQWNHTQT